MLAFLSILLIFTTLGLAPSQIESAPQSPSGVQEQPTTLEENPGITIKAHSNLVQVRVVVQDNAGRQVNDLKQENFQIYDQGKLQTISTFVVETPTSREEQFNLGTKNESIKEQVSTFILPERFVSLVFDDTRLSPTDALLIRNAAQAVLEGITARDRVGVHSTSGQLTQEFTSDSAVLKKTIARVSPSPLAMSNNRSCPNVTYSTANRIENNHDSEGMDAVVQETLMCAFGGDARKMPYAQLMAQSAIHQALRAGEAENGFALRHLEDALRRLAQMPGERVLVLVSPGFLLVQQPHGERQIVEQANRANIVINTIDARGLNVSGGAEDISRQSTDMSATGDYKSRDRMDADRDRSIVLADFAHGTGGTFFHNSNDLTAGIKMAALPKICYVLGFSPHDLKEDGRYHSLEVKLTGKQKYSVQARRGYFAPTRLNPKEQEDQDIAEELHSRAEFGNLLSELRAQPSMNGQDKPQLLVRSQVAVQNVRFKTMNGKRVDVLRMVTAIFDENGNLVTGGEKILTLNLDNPAYEKLSRAGLTVNLSFGVKPGKYLVRQLLRDSEAGEIATKNRAVEIAE